MFLLLCTTGNHCMVDIVNYTLFTTGYFCIPMNILEAFREFD